MNELDIKIAKCVELQKTKNKVRWLAIATILSFAVTLGAGVKMICDYERLNPYDLDDTLLALKSSEYGEYVNFMQDKYTEELCSGQIDKEEYCELCRSLNSEDGVVAWVKTLHDEKVDEAIDIYNMAKRRRLQTTIGNASAFVVGAGVGAMFGVGCLDNITKYETEKRRYDKKYKDSGYIPR